MKRFFQRYNKNVIKLIGQTDAGDGWGSGEFNMMTASWDHKVVNKPVVMVFVANVTRSSLRRKKMSLPCRFLTRSTVMH
ncbi:MAG: hypothetical protein ACLU4N_07195 [Butyricimonas faecihominis]